MRYRMPQLQTLDLLYAAVLVIGSRIGWSFGKRFGHNGAYVFAMLGFGVAIVALYVFAATFPGAVKAINRKH